MLRLPVAGEVVASEQATSLQRLRAGGVSGVTSVVSSMARISRLISHEIGTFFTVSTNIRWLWNTRRLMLLYLKMTSLTFSGHLANCIVSARDVTDSGCCLKTQNP